MPTKTSTGSIQWTNAWTLRVKHGIPPSRLCTIVAGGRVRTLAVANGRVVYSFNDVRREAMARDWWSS